MVKISFALTLTFEHNASALNIFPVILLLLKIQQNCKSFLVLNLIQNK